MNNPGRSLRAFFRGLARVQRTFTIEIGPLRASGVPAFLLGVTGIVLASGVTAALARARLGCPRRWARREAWPRRSTRVVPAAAIVIEDAALTDLIRSELPDAEVGIVDRTGTMDHFNVTVRSKAFRGERP